MNVVAAFVLGLSLSLHGSVIAAAAEPLKLELLTTSAQITPGSADQQFANVTVIVSGSKRASVSVRVIDLVLDKSGKSPVPVGSTKYTLANQVKFEPESFNYVPSIAPQKFTFRVTAANKELAEVRYGGIQSVLSSKPSENESPSEIGAITTFALVPNGLSLSLSSSAIKSTEISGLRLVQKSKDSLADWIFPDIPGIANRAPVTLQVKILNKNELPVFTTQRVTWSDKTKSLQVSDLPQRLLFGDQVITLSQDSTTPVGNSSVQRNFAKPFDSLNVKIAFSTFLGDQSLEPVTREVSVLIFPWKELLFWTLILALVVWRLIRTRGKLLSRTEPNIVWLFLVWIYRLAVRKLKSPKRS